MIGRRCPALPSVTTATLAGCLFIQSVDFLSYLQLEHGVPTICYSRLVPVRRIVVQRRRSIDASVRDIGFTDFRVVKVSACDSIGRRHYYPEVTPRSVESFWTGNQNSLTGETHHLITHFATFEEKKSRNSADRKPAGKTRTVVHIDSRDLTTSRCPFAISSNTGAIRRQGSHQEAEKWTKIGTGD